MNKTAIKNYAVWARNELITRVTQKAFEYGVEKNSIIDANANSINGKLLTTEEKKQRQQLINEVHKKGFDQVIEEVAYTWFNRFIALRYMEVNNYLPNRIRVFTNENNEFKPQILDEAMNIELDGLDKELVFNLLESNNQEELYKQLLITTCNDMGNYLPGMFTKISDYMVLLFPNNLLKNGSVISNLVLDLDQNEWMDAVQILGWLYQFYNSEPKNIAMKKNTISKQDIAAVTQLFTPDWIVRYMTENSLGRLWMSGHKNLKCDNWEYYLNDLDQSKSVLNEINYLNKNLNPTDIKIIDPCMGSGHILVYAFDVLMEIYKSEGYSDRDAAKLILQKNLYGLEIDKRAYQLAYFAVMMKARAYNRKILNDNVNINLIEIVDSTYLSNQLLRYFKENEVVVKDLVNLFINAKEMGSLINVNYDGEHIESLICMLEELNYKKDDMDLISQSEISELHDLLLPILKQALILSQKYDVVITNPPYMSPTSMQKPFINDNYPNSKTDLYAVFIERCNELCNQNGYVAMITMHNWMFISAFEKLRSNLLKNFNFISLLHFGIKAFEEIGNDVVQTCAFIMEKNKIEDYETLFVRLVDYKRDYLHKKEQFFNSSNYFKMKISSFLLIPGNPFAYWVSNSFINNFKRSENIEKYAEFTGSQNITGNNDKYLRCFWEIEDYKINNLDWVFYSKGGDYRKYYGNLTYVIDWRNDARKFYETNKTSNLLNEKFWYREGITYSAVTSRGTGFRLLPKNCIFDKGGPSIITLSKRNLILALLNSKVANIYFNVFNPSINLQVKDVKNFPIIFPENDVLENIIDENIGLAQKDWDSFETSYSFKESPLLHEDNISNAISSYLDILDKTYQKVLNNEIKINDAISKTYDMESEVNFEFEKRDIPITLRDKTELLKEFISYAVGCMFGRYSLDYEGLAFAGGKWDDAKYITFTPDKDNIIPICDDEYFEDDIVGKFVKFVEIVYGKETLESNLKFIADALGGKGTPREIIRQYFLNDFFKDHCNTYQVTGSGKRPIYWLFDSGKKNGFKALVYIHRYTPDLIARMRTQYIHEQQVRYRNQIELLENQIDGDISTSERVRLNKKLKTLKEQDDELRKYEEKIHHWADKMESMNLDDGVKVNYAKFQELLAKIK